MNFYTTSNADSTYHALTIGELPNPSKNTKQKNRHSVKIYKQVYRDTNRTKMVKLPMICQASVHLHFDNKIFFF